MRKAFKLFGFIVTLVLFVLSVTMIVSGEAHTNGGSIEAVMFFFCFIIAFITGLFLFSKLIFLIISENKNKDLGS